MAVLTNSSTGVSVDFDPEWGYKDNSKKVQQQTRTLAGDLYTYKFSDYAMFDVPVMHINSSDTYNINQWWENNDELYFTDPSSDVYNVRIISKNKPLNARVEPYIDLFRGTIKLEEI